MKNPVTKMILFATRLPMIGGAVKRWVQNRFDAAFQGWGERSWLFQSLQDAWLEIDAMTRQELQRISDSLAENSPIVDKILDLKVQFSVGAAGLKIIPESSDEGFNDARSISFETWWKRPELGCTISGAQLTRIWARTLPQRGEVFVNLTEEEIIVGTRKQKVPRTQTIECHRVKSPSGLTADKQTGFPIIDGEVVNPKTGASVAWFVRKQNFFGGTGYNQQTTVEEFDRIPTFDPANPSAGGIVHIFHRMRFGQRRGLPCGVSGFNMVRDNMDLHKLMMNCAKIRAEIALVETNPSGELDALLNRKSKLQIATQNVAGASTVKNSFVDYNVSVGGKKIAMKVGSKIEDFVTNMPSPAQQDYLDLHVTYICIAWKVPKMLVMPYSLQGTVTRADLDICTAAFRQDFELIRELCEIIFAWQGEWDLKSNLNFTGEKRLKALKNFHGEMSGEQKQVMARAQRSAWVMDAATPDDAHVCLIRPPRPPNVDIGYTAKALEIEMRLGVKTFQRHFADQNLDWRTEFRQLAEAQVYLTDLCNEPMFKGKVTPGQLTSLAVPQPVDDPTSKPDAPEGDSKEGSPSNQFSKAVIY